MRIRAGLTGRSHGWEQLLVQEGLPFSVLAAGEELADMSVLVVTRPPTPGEGEAIRAFLKTGGAVLSSATNLREIAGGRSRTERVRYLLPDEAGGTFDIRLLDLDAMCEISAESSFLRTDQSGFGVFAGEVGGGLAVLLPFDPAEALLDTRAAHRMFPARGARLPVERVSRVGKNEVRHLVHSAFRFLHHRRGLPYAHLWYFPSGSPGVFAYRVDTDGAPWDDIATLHRISTTAGLPCSWFLDVQSHESWLSRFTTFDTQEIGVHCYVHRVFKTYPENYNNLRTAVDALATVGIRPRGFSAPYGVWTPSLRQTLMDLGFEYSSEFAFAYDTLPIMEQAPGGIASVLQVPFHPICPGSLRRIGFGEAEMIQYFSGIVADKLQRAEPLFFYHHPSHRSWDAVRALMDDVTARGIPGLTMGEFARWWRTRSAASLEAHVYDGAVNVTLQGRPEDVGTLAVRVLFPDNGEAIVTAPSRVEQSQSVTKLRTGGGSIEDLRRTREFDLRSAIAAAYSGIGRRFR